jgi:hypothetical protein
MQAAVYQVGILGLGSWSAPAGCNSDGDIIKHLLADPACCGLGAKSQLTGVVYIGCCGYSTLCVFLRLGQPLGSRTVTQQRLAGAACSPVTLSSGSINLRLSLGC